MPSRSFPISKKQLDLIDNIGVEIDALSKRRNTILETIILGAEDPPSGATSWRTEAKDGVYTLTIEIPEPDPAPPAPAKAEQPSG